MYIYMYNTYFPGIMFCGRQRVARGRCGTSGCARRRQSSARTKITTQLILASTPKGFVLEFFVARF